VSRAARRPKTKSELEQLSLAQLNAELKYLQIRRNLAGTSPAAKAFQKEIDAVKRVRDARHER
jgi:hypothetical protein